MDALFIDRHDAGVALADALERYAHAERTIVLGLPRGGVPVAHDVARRLGLPLDVLVVRKLGVPWQPELAVGAVGPEGVCVLDHELIDKLGEEGRGFAGVIEREHEELERRETAYRRGRGPLDLAGWVVILVDDGLATGWTMRTAVAAARRMGAARVVVAVPVAPAAACSAIEAVADELVCLATPEPFYAVGQWYADFAQVSDADVRRLLSTTGRLEALSTVAGGTSVSI